MMSNDTKFAITGNCEEAKSFLKKEKEGNETAKAIPKQKKDRPPPLWRFWSAADLPS
jgi:hypothetical protein